MLSICRMLLCLPPVAFFLDDFLKMLAIDRQLLPRVLSHFSSDLKPVHRHTFRISQELRFSNTKLVGNGHALGDLHSVSQGESIRATR